MESEGCEGEQRRDKAERKNDDGQALMQERSQGHGLHAADLKQILIVKL